MAYQVKPTGIGNVWATAGVIAEPDAAKIAQGWVVELPPYQYANWYQNKQGSFAAHVNQVGIPVWDATTEYQGGKSYTQGSDGLIYKALVTSTNVDPANPLNSATWVRAFESYGSVAALQVQVDLFRTQYDTLSGIANTNAARTNLSVFSKAETTAQFAAISGNAANTFSVADATADQHAITRGQLNSLISQATEVNVGVSRFATQSEANVGTIDTVALTPLKATNVFLRRADNLSTLTNTAAARANLGLGTMAVQEAGDYLDKAGNLFGLDNNTTARANLGLGSIATRSSTDFLDKAGNLAGLTSVATARNNLGLESTAVTDISVFLLKNQNLAGLTNTATARANLGLGSIATQSIGTFMQKAENLAGLTNIQTARNNLGLGSAATQNVYGASSLDFTASQGGTGYQRLPSGLTMQWGQGPALNDDQSTFINLPVSGTILSVQVTGIGFPTNGVGPCFITDAWSTTRFRVSNNYTTGVSIPFSWFVITT